MQQRPLAQQGEQQEITSLLHINLDLSIPQVIRKLQVISPERHTIVKIKQHFSQQWIDKCYSFSTFDEIKKCRNENLLVRSTFMNCFLVVRVTVRVIVSPHCKVIVDEYSPCQKGKVTVQAVLP